MKHTTFGILATVAMLFVSGAGYGDAAAHGGFSLASLKGSYAGIFSGNINTRDSLVPILGTGIFVADGHGHLTGHESYTVATTRCEASISGTYTVNSDGSGTDSATFTTPTPGCTGGNYSQAFAIAGHGELVFLSNTNGDQINEEWHLQVREARGGSNASAGGTIATDAEQ